MRDLIPTMHGKGYTSPAVLERRIRLVVASSFFFSKMEVAQKDTNTQLFQENPRISPCSKRSLDFGEIRNNRARGSSFSLFRASHVRRF